MKKLQPQYILSYLLFITLLASCDVGTNNLGMEFGVVEDSVEKRFPGSEEEVYVKSTKEEKEWR